MSIVQSGVQAISVLIDTWWNVNLEEERWKSTGVTVLIDTWWNVNFFIYIKFPTYRSFNRYMVECELISRRAWN